VSPHSFHLLGTMTSPSLHIRNLTDLQHHVLLRFVHFPRQAAVSDRVDDDCLVGLGRWLLEQLWAYLVFLPDRQTTDKSRRATAGQQNYIRLRVKTFKNSL